MHVQCIVTMALEELNAKNKIGWDDGRTRLDGKTKVVDRCRHAFTVTQPVVSRKLSCLGNATKERFGRSSGEISGEETRVISKLAFIAHSKNNPQKRT